MSAVPCPVLSCDRPTSGATICGACQADLERALRSVGWLAGELDVTLSRQTGQGEGGGSEVPLPYDTRASEAAFVLRSALVGWVRVLQEGEERREGPLCRACTHLSCVLMAQVGNDLGSMGSWLLRRSQRLAVHQAAEEAVDEICSAVRAAIKVIDRPPGSVYAGPCEKCGNALHVPPHIIGGNCRECGAEFWVEDRWNWMRDQCWDLLGSSTYVAMVCTGLGYPVSESTIRMWKGRSHLAPHHYEEPRGDGTRRQRPVYRVGDVIEVWTGKVRRYTA